MMRLCWLALLLACLVPLAAQETVPEPSPKVYSGIVDKLQVSDMQTATLQKHLRHLHSRVGLAIGVAYTDNIDDMVSHPQDPDYHVQVLYHPSSRQWKIYWTSDLVDTDAGSPEAVAAVLHRYLSQSPAPDWNAFHIAVAAACIEITERAQMGYAGQLFFALSSLGRDWILHGLAGLAMTLLYLTWAQRIQKTYRNLLAQGITTFHNDFTMVSSAQVVFLIIILPLYYIFDSMSIDQRGSVIVLYYGLLGLVVSVMVVQGMPTIPQAAEETPATTDTAPPAPPSKAKPPKPPKPPRKTKPAQPPPAQPASSPSPSPTPTQRRLDL